MQESPAGDHLRRRHVAPRHFPRERGKGGKWGRRRRAPLAASERTSDMKPRHDIYQTITAELAAAIDAGAGQWRMPWHHDGGTVMRPTSAVGRAYTRSEEHTSELQSLMRISYAVFCLKKKKHKKIKP